MANFNALNTVTANPTETATEELQKLKVGNTVYSVEGGGSGGGLTKTKVTLAELQTMLTADNLGTLVSYNFKVFPPALSQISELVPSALLFSGVGDGVTTIKQVIDTSTNIFISNSHFAFVLNKMIAVTLTISSDLISGELLFDSKAYTIQEQYLTDEYFDFYIYK